MKILLLTHAFNSLSQRLFVELRRLGHELSVEFDINDEITVEAVELFRPDIVIAPFLKRAIPACVWRKVPCWIVHPGIVGDRGPSALDWAILKGESQWGVTILQANDEMDAGDIWATRSFPVVEASKSSLYRNEVTEAAVDAVFEALEKFQSGASPEPLDCSKPGIRGRWQPLMKQEHRAIDWERDDLETVLRKIRCGDGYPGLRVSLGGLACLIFNAIPDRNRHGTPGAVIASQNGAICIGCRGGAVWITHARLDAPGCLKLPAATVLKPILGDVPDSDVPPGDEGDLEIRSELDGMVALLHFNFYNGAMSTAQCERLSSAYRSLKRPGVRVIVLAGGESLWSNGINLNTIENAEHPAHESWANINAMNDLVLEIINTEYQLVVSALGGNAGAGGVFLALSADHLWARSSAILNPHYKNMGNLYGSEYWTYLLPGRIGRAAAEKVMGERLPIGAAEAKACGLIDEVFIGDSQKFRHIVLEKARRLAEGGEFDECLARKSERRRRDELVKPLARYRAEELERMKLNFYGFDPSYHVARYNFVYRVPKSRTPYHLARHRA